jgi:hypothetical protein
MFGGVQVIVEGGGVVRLSNISGIRSRATPSGSVSTPLAVSAARALAAVCATQRITVFDLEGQESEADEDEGAWDVLKAG